MNLAKHIATLERRALLIKKTLGTRAAAGYLRNRKVPVAFAVRLLAGSK
jgi:hypothetical protein